MTGPTDVPDVHFPASSIRSVGELIATLPLLLGLRPVNSLVLVTHSRSTSASSPFIRVDLPAPQDIPAVVAQLRDVLVTCDVVAVTVVVVGGGLTGPGIGFLPQRDLVHALTVGLRAAEITVRKAVWAASTNTAARWRCYDVCRCSGSVPGLDTSPVAAELIMAGATAADSRELLAATLAADPDDQLERRAAMLDARLRNHATPGITRGRDAGYRTVREAIAAAADHPALPVLTDAQIVDLAWALCDPQVRGRCLADTVLYADSATSTSYSAGSGVVSEDPDAAARLWTVLTRAVPAPARAEPAFLLAVHTHLRGNGVLAAIALDIARNANPQHLLAQVLDLAIQHGMSPAQLQHLLQAALTPRVDADR